MVTVEDCILGNGALHDRFFATTEILAKLVSRAPRTVSLVQLEEATGRPGKELSKLCNGLLRSGLLHQDPLDTNKWSLTCDPSLVTLEDVYRFVLAEQPSRSKASAKSSASDRARNDVDLLVMQAMITINQSVFKHLRQFSLDRLKVSAAGMFPAARRPLDDDFDHAVATHEPGFSPMQAHA